VILRVNGNYFPKQNLPIFVQESFFVLSEVDSEFLNRCDKRFGFQILLTFIMEMLRVFFAVGTEFLNIICIKFVFIKLN
jgi:hypothetical protein